METYCVSCKKNSANKNSNVKNTKQNGCLHQIVLYEKIEVH